MHSENALKPCAEEPALFAPSELPRIICDEALLTRDKVAAALTDCGYPISPKTLATKATRGGGPPYQKFSGRALYRWRDALDWARSVTTPPRHSTSEADVKPTSPSK